MPVETCAPMKRGLKTAKQVIAQLAEKVETCAPMKRGLKAASLPDATEHPPVVETCAPMKRGLKANPAAHQHASVRWLKPVPR